MENLHSCVFRCRIGVINIAGGAMAESCFMDVKRMYVRLNL